MSKLNAIKNWISKTAKQFTDGGSEENLNNAYFSNENEILYGTPFWLTKGNEDGTVWFLTFANYKLREAKTKIELVEWFKENTVNVMADMIVIIIELQKQKQNEK